jgi:hypothetical protein
VKADTAFAHGGSSTRCGSVKRRVFDRRGRTHVAVKLAMFAS